jgi:iron complex transport system ATP-binding protein
VRRLAEQSGTAVVVVEHDMRFVQALGARVVVMLAGRVVADGPPRDVLSDDNLARVFGVRGFHAETADGPVFQPMGVVR